MLLEESNIDLVPSSPKVNNNNVAKKTTLIMQCEVVRRRSPRLSLSQGFKRLPRLSSDRGNLESLKSHHRRDDALPLPLPLPDSLRLKVLEILCDVLN
uniref:Uncharacterized protein n=1 Tax=Quercus lobata TaxID=97700 RepID=A0A7N2R4J8_QUELO